MPEITCEYCGTRVWKPHKETRFCSRSHSRFGNKNGWKGGKHVHKTTKRTFLNTTEGLKFEYRVIMEGILGRPLTSSEVVHHKDGDPTNNDPSNLEVMTRSDHIRLHNYLNPRRDHRRDSMGRFTHKERE